MSIIHDLLKWQTSTRTPRRHPGNGDFFWLLSEFRCLEGDNLLFKGVEYDFVPPLVCKFNVDGLHGNLLAVADEEGVVGLYDTRKKLSESQLSGFMAHRNAVFDLAWVPGGTKMVTASGDKKLCLWDVIGETQLTSFSGHKGSVKSVCVRQDEPSVLVSGSRDGSIMVWDMRCTSKGSSQKPVNTIHSAHERAVGREITSKNRRSKTPSVSGASVTAVLFHGDNKIASCGASDGIVKLWDMRRYYTTNKMAPPPCWHSFATVERDGRAFGFNSLVSDHHQSSLFASCTDDIIYKYSTSTLSRAPVDGFSGHKNTEFYVKSCLSSDGEYLLSGSTCSSAYIWQVNKSEAPPLLLQGHAKEVTAVDWCPTSIDKVATCSDDNDLFLWRVTRGDVLSCERGVSHTYGDCSQYTGDEHLKAKAAVEAYGQSPKESTPPNRDCTPCVTAQSVGGLKNSLKINSPDKSSPPSTMTPTLELSTQILTPRPKNKRTPSQTGSENIPQETPMHLASSSMAAKRKRKLVWSADTQTTKSRKVACSTCGASPVTGRHSVARKQAWTCDKCLKRTQTSLQSFFKPL